MAKAMLSFLYKFNFHPPVMFPSMFSLDAPAAYRTGYR